MSIPLPANEAAGPARLRHCNVLDTPPEAICDEVIQLAARLCGVPTAAVRLLDEERRWFQSILGLESTETSRDAGFCTHTILPSDLRIVPEHLTAGQEALLRMLARQVAGRIDLQRSEGRLALTQRTAQIGTWEFDMETGRMAWSQEMFRLLGFDPAHGEPSTEKMIRRFHPDDVPLYEQMTRQVLRDGLPAACDMRILREGDAVRWVSVTGQAAPNAAGGGAQILGTLMDITARKEAEMALQEERQFLNALQENMSDGVVACDAQGALRLFNRATREFHGLPEQPLPPSEWSEHYDLFQGDGETPMQTADIPLFRAFQGEVVRDAEMVIAPKNGQARTLIANGQPIYDAQGKKVGAVATMHDITARKQEEAARLAAEDNYRALFENAAEGIFRTAPEGRYLKANPALAHLYGYATPTEMMASLTDVGGQLYVKPERRPEFQRLMQLQGRVSGFESQVRRKDGRVIWISESARPVYDAMGTLCWYEGFVEDISDRKALEDQQAQALREAREQADCDALTGLWNHRAFHKKLEEEAGRARREETTLAVVMLDMDNFKFFNDVYGHAVGDDVLHLVAKRLQSICRPYDTLARFGGDEFALLLSSVGNHTASELAARLRSDLRGLVCWPDGDERAIPITISLGVGLFPQHSLDWREVLRHADEHLLRSKTGGGAKSGAETVRASALRVEGFSMLDALVTAVDNKDRYTRRHSEDVMTYSLMIARQLPLDEQALDTIALAALLHDVGKIGVPDAILRKPSKLTEAEFAAIRQHPQMGAVMVGAVPGLEATLDAVRHHHERWDGRGYPSGMKGKEIPLMARLMAVADAFSAMTTDRPYRQGMDPEKALSILEAGAGTQWDPECVQAFIQAEQLST